MEKILKTTRKNIIAVKIPMYEDKSRGTHKILAACNSGILCSPDGALLRTLRTG